MYIVTFFVTDFYAAIKYFARWLWSAASNDTAETDRRADGRTDATDCSTFVAYAVRNEKSLS